MINTWLLWNYPLVIQRINNANAFSFVPCTYTKNYQNNSKTKVSISNNVNFLSLNLVEVIVGGFFYIDLPNVKAYRFHRVRAEQKNVNMISLRMCM